MTMEILDGRRDISGGYKVDASRGQRVSRVSSEWFSRPADEQFLSLSELFASVRGRAERSRTRTVESAAIRVEASRDNTDRLALMLPGSETPVAPTHWSFGSCLSGCHPQPLAVVFRHAHGHSPAWQSSVPTIAPRVPATFSRRRGLRRLPGEGSLERRVCLPPLSAEEYLPLQQAVLSVQRLPYPARHRGRRHRTLPTQSFTPEPGSILHVGGVGNNRIGKLRPTCCARRRARRLSAPASGAARRDQSAIRPDRASRRADQDARS